MTDTRVFCLLADAGPVPEEIRQDPLKRAFEMQHAEYRFTTETELETLASDRHDPRPDLLDLRFSGTAADRILPAAEGREVPRLVSNRLFVSEETAAGLYPPGGIVFVDLEQLYHPVFLELKSIVLSGRFGAFQSAELSCTVSGGESAAGPQIPPAAVDQLFWLFGVPAGVSSGFPGDNRTVLQAVLRYERAAVQCTLVRIPGAGLRTVYRWAGFLQFERATLDFYVENEQAECVVHPVGEKDYSLSVPEGDGNYYLAKDVLEALHEKRNSGILAPEAFLSCRRETLALFRGSGADKTG